MSIPLVALIGRPNVGKSSLFNRFLQKKLAIVDDTPGVTRDRNYGLCEWAGREFYLVDTGGMLPNSKGAIEKMILTQSEIAIEDSDLTVLIVDNQTGLDSTEQKIAKQLLKSGKNAIILANKIDDDLSEHERFQFSRLGLGDPLAVSATVGLGIGEALDSIIEHLPPEGSMDYDSDAIRIAVIGRPNVGKSSFINKLIGEERVIVSPIPGTTRDAVDTPFEFEGRKYILVDTAGLRRKAKVKDAIEYFTTLRTLRAIENCDIALVLVDASEGLIVQDLKVIEDAAEVRRGIVMAVNKWDLIEKDTHTADIFTSQIKEYARTLAYIPNIYISCLTGQRVVKVLPQIDKVYKNWDQQIPTSELNNFLEEIVERRHPAAIKGKYIKLFYVTQSGVKPPTFLFFCNFPQLIQKSYIRYIENQLRNKYEFDGVPIRIRFKKRK
ncbi:MAG: ribosome biogenesis GTPase Der [candidate division Zixibacteria bacterium]|nr:ribosome biogenesis GTPase Der [candidate division Zixibacteria bacterium]